jgi:hypothetical protein
MQEGRKGAGRRAGSMAGKRGVRRVRRRVKRRARGGEGRAVGAEHGIVQLHLYTFCYPFIDLIPFRSVPASPHVQNKSSSNLLTPLQKESAGVGPRKWGSYIRIGMGICRHTPKSSWSLCIDTEARELLEVYRCDLMLNFNPILMAQPSDIDWCKHTCWGLIVPSIHSTTEWKYQGSTLTAVIPYDMA